MTSLTWNDAAEWDANQSEDGVVHEAVANTDHDDASVIKQGYSHANPYLSSDLVLFCPMNEDSGATINDVSGNGNNGSMNGSTPNADGLLDTSAISMDGSDDWNDWTGLQVSADDDYTYSVWMYDESGSDSTRRWMFDGISVFGDVANGIREDSGNSGPSIDLAVGGNATTHSVTDWKGRWALWTVVSDASAGETREYLDTALEATQNNTATPQSDWYCPAYYDDQTKEYFNGRMAYHAVWNRSLTAAEIQTMYDVVDKAGAFTTAKKVA